MCLFFQLNAQLEPDLVAAAVAVEERLKVLLHELFEEDPMLEAVAQHLAPIQAVQLICCSIQVADLLECSVVELPVRSAFLLQILRQNLQQLVVVVGDLESVALMVGFVEAEQILVFLGSAVGFEQVVAFQGCLHFLCFWVLLMKSRYKIRKV